MKRFGIMFEQEKVERLNDLARRRSVELAKNLSWADLVREACEQLLASDARRSAKPSNSQRVR